MFESLKYIKKKFPYFLDMTEDSNVTKVTKLLDDSYIDICNSLERVRDGYYYLNTPYPLLELMDAPVMINQENTIVFKINDLNEGDTISFNSLLFGELGEAKLEELEEKEFKEHISIITGTVKDNIRNYHVSIIADDIKTVTIVNLGTGDETVKEFEYTAHQKEYTQEIPLTSDDYKVTVETWNEYTYTSYTTDYNPDLDHVSKTLTGATRRNYLKNDTKTIIVDAVVDTNTGDDINDGLTMNTAYQSLTHAIQLGRKVIGFIGCEKSKNYTLTTDTTIIGDGEQSQLTDVVIWLEPRANLILKNILFNNVLITEKTVHNTTNTTILIR